MNNRNPLPYRNRRTRFVNVRQIADWQLKIYMISASGNDIKDEVMSAANSCIESGFDWNGIAGKKDDSTSSWPRCGFVTIHEGEEAVWLQVDLWADDILKHFLFRASLACPTDFIDNPPDGTFACVWELNVVCHERDSWVRHILSRPSNPDVGGYLSDGLNLKNPRTTTG